MREIKYGREVIGGLGESSGVTCPYCGARDYPQTEDVATCVLCGNDYGVPLGCRVYGRKELVK